MKKHIIFSIILLILFSCEHPKPIHLGDDYYLIRSASFNDLTIVKSNNTGIIRGHVLNYIFDSTFILLTQRPRDSFPSSDKMKYSDYQKKFNSSTFKQYWIINKKEKNDYYFDTISNTARYSNVYGPFNKDVYLQKRKQLGVPHELRLKELK